MVVTTVKSPTQGAASYLGCSLSRWYQSWWPWPFGARWVNYSAYALYFQLRLLYAIINRLRKEICCCQQTGGKSSLSSWSSLLCLEHPPFLKSCWRHMLLSNGSFISLTSETRDASSLPTSQCPILMAICLLNVLVNVLLLHKAFLQRSHEFNL